LIRLINEETGTLDLIATYGLSAEFLDKGPVSAEKSIAETLKGKTVVVEDVAAFEQIQYRQEHLKEGVVSMLSVPIKSKQKVIGVMRLYSAVKRDYPEDLLMLVEALAIAARWPFRMPRCTSSSRRTKKPWRRMFGATEAGSNGRNRPPGSLVPMETAIASRYSSCLS